ncbi:MULTISPECIES: polyphosphate--glucose phosphotransferase [Allobranchiibius]|uniref:Polyphosphate glucokinase n=1 Tax=Allobranchiibius huperziae TaxID=1874116 RepID=A0A853DJP6_9MICO|nr:MULTISPECIES: ROK family protein [Allobranchiibius]MBO1768130.1 ROK family protein [Allobranchiibius sp. GilTou38]NYJ74375.1 polyphosphate glucokinase [Allobranchiibius huperziae]
MSTTHPLGIDVGGTGIKGAPVDLRTGEFAADRLRIDTPKESTPDAVADVIEKIVDHFKDLVGEQPIGVTLPSVVTHGVVRSAANIDQSWIGTNVEELLQGRLGRPATVLNDADAAGVGELRFGAARNTEGLVLVSTLGTGIGSALLNKGQLVPNSELGHLEIDGHDAESKASSAAKDREELSWEDWAARLQRYYSHVEDLLWPDLIVVGGGVSKKADKFLPLLHLRAPIVAAQLRNAAGIVGAAYEAVESAKAEGTHRE